MRYDDATREAIAREVLGGASASSVARAHGVSEGSVRNWARALEERLWEEDAERCRSEADAEKRRPASAAAAARRPGEVVLLELETRRGRTLVMVDRRRDGSPSGSVRRIAGPALGDGPLSGAVRRRWVVDLAGLVRAVAAAVANDPGSTTTQRQALRVMTGGAE